MKRFVKQRKGYNKICQLTSNKTTWHVNSALTILCPSPSQNQLALQDEDFNPSSDSEDERPAKKRKATASAEKKDDAADDNVELKEEDEEDDDSDDDDSDESDDDESVELVSEDEFSMGQLQNMIRSEKEKGTSDGQQDDDDDNDKHT